MSLDRYLYRFTWYPDWKPISQHWWLVDEIELASAIWKYIFCGTGYFNFINDPLMLRKWFTDIGKYSDTFWSIFSYFLQVIFEFIYVGLVHYGFARLRINYSHLILEHVSFILLYQDILNNLNYDPTYDIANYRRKALFEFKVCCKYFIWPSFMYLGGFHSQTNKLFL